MYCCIVFNVSSIVYTLTVLWAIQLGILYEVENSTLSYKLATKELGISPLFRYLLLNEHNLYYYHLHDNKAIYIEVSSTNLKYNYNRQTN